ncbi:ankyrin repeat-containing domain protein [Xylariaceae sp. AK1471]|nr:ankyrin repeat-containing domain protein [Xylariaceae sp. AK1471]
MDAISPARPVEELQLALSNFCAILTDEQRRDLSEIRTVPDADSILVFTAQLDFANRSRRGRSVGSRVIKLLHSTRDFCGVIDTFVSSNPGVAALVWGSVKLTMQITVNYTSYYEAISGLFMQLGSLCPLFAEYRTLYRSSKQLQKSLSDFHASIVRCCKHVIEAIKRPWHNQVLQAFYKSFDQEFQPDTDDLRRCSDSVKDAINLAKAHVDAQEQKLQAQERAAASEGRKWIKSLVSRTSSDNDKWRELWSQREERRAQDQKQRLLDALCTYRPERLLKQNQRKRFGSTTSWVFQTPEFCQWVDMGGPPLLWCSGKIGSGKTVVAASVVDYFFLEKGRSDCLVSYFFIHSGDQESLNVETVIRSILRQRLPTPTQMSHEIEERLRGLNHDSELDEIVEFLHDITHTSKPSYIIIDGLDECEKPSRYRLLKALSSLVATAINTKLFLASRESLSGEIRKHFSSIKQISMDDAGAQDDMITYINGILQDKIDRQELEVGDPSLITEIEQALTRGADGMFLWVFFQVHELCEQTCDEDIRQTLINLPEDLEETFRRVLRRIASRKLNRLAQKVFPWIAAAARPLSLEELREAIAIDIGQLYSIPERLCNDTDSILLSCENLVHVDEEDQSIQFAHHTIKQFLLQRPALLRQPVDNDLRMFYIDPEEADHFIGEICITYLNFNDFKTTLSRRPKPITLPSPPDVALAALGPKLNMTYKLGRMFRSGRVPTPIDIDRIIKSSTNDSNSKPQVIYNAHPFLNYASTNWVLHTKTFQDKHSNTWNLWKNIIVNGHDLAVKPWQPESWGTDDPGLLRWAQQAHHNALGRLIISSRTLSSQEVLQFINCSMCYQDITLLDIFLQNQTLDINYALLAAAEGGHPDAVERLLAAKANINATSNEGRSALYAAAEYGHLDVVERLLAANANVNATSNEGRSALEAAAESGHLDVVERLLAANANVNATSNEGCSALYAAAGGGHLDVVERLLVAKVNVNATSNEGRSALEAAAESGHLDVVERLLTAKANVNATSNEDCPALKAAARGGYLDVVERLLAANANVNTGNESRSALYAAAECGHLDVVERLLAANANVNAGYEDSPALYAAAERGHLDIVERLLAANANVNTSYEDCPALYAAAGGGYLDVVERLLVAKANVNISYEACSALTAAARGGYLDVVEKLLAVKANVNTSRGDCPALEAAAGGGYLNVVERLLVAKVNVNSSGGRAALEAAASGGHLDVVKRLKQAGAMGSRS